MLLRFCLNNWKNSITFIKKQLPIYQLFYPNTSMRTKSSLLLLTLLGLLAIQKVSLGQYGMREEGIIYLKNKKTPLQGNFKISDNYRTVSIIQGKEKQTFQIAEIDSIKTQNNGFFVVKEYHGSPVLLEASVIAPVSLLFSKKLNLFFYSKGTELSIIPKDKLRGHLLVLFPDFSYTAKLRDAKYLKVKYTEEYLAQLVTTYNEETYPKFYPKVYALPSITLKLSISPYLGMTLNSNTTKFLNRQELVDYRVNIQPQLGLRINLEGMGRFSAGLQTYWTKIYGHLPVDLGVSYTQMKEKYQYVTLGEFVQSGVGVDIPFRYELGDTRKSKIRFKAYAGPSFFLPLSSSNKVYNTVPKYVNSNITFTPEFLLKTSDDRPNVLFGINAGLSSMWSLNSKYDLNIDAGLKYLQMPNSYTTYRNSLATYNINSLQVGIGVYVSPH